MNTNELFIDSASLPKALNEEEFYELFNKYKNGDTTARDKLIMHNIKLVIYIINNKLKNINYAKKDLISIGNMGLIKAVDTFDYYKNIKFATYASRCIENEILMFVRKIKKDSLLLSMNETLNTDLDGEEFTLEQILTDGEDFTETIIQKETNKILKEIIDKLSYPNNEKLNLILNIINNLKDRDKKIILLYFSFYNNRKYTQQEIANIFKISRSYVSKIIDENISNIKELVTSNNVNVKSNVEIELKTLYDYFNQYNKNDINIMLTKLKESDIETLKIIFGNDFITPIPNNDISNNLLNYFYDRLVPKIKLILAGANEEKSIKHNEVLEENNKLLENSKIEQSKEIEESIRDNKDVDNYMNLLDILKSISFTKFLSNYSTEEVIVFLLKIGYIDNKQYSTIKISSFLNINKEKINNITKKILLDYKEEINKLINIYINELNIVKEYKKK